MHLSKAYRTTTQPHVGNPFSLSPAARPEAPPQLRQLANRRTDSDRFNLSYLSDKFEIYIHGSLANLFADPRLLTIGLLQRGRYARG
jgi:hypothetical protein